MRTREKASLCLGIRPCLPSRFSWRGLLRRDGHTLDLYAYLSAMIPDEDFHRVCDAPVLDLRDPSQRFLERRADTQVQVIRLLRHAEHLPAMTM